jgi:hypothetical protein
MKTWTVHLRAGTAPVLVPETFCWTALLLGPLWLLAHRAWIAAVLVLCAETAALAAAHGTLRLMLALAILWSLGLFGQDLRRWSLGRRGFVLSHVVAAATGDAATARLLDLRPELAREALA